MRRLLGAARKGGCPVVFTKVQYSDLGMKDAGLFWLKTKALDVWLVGDHRGLDGGLEGLEPYSRAEGEAGDEWVVKKKYPSAFFGTTLATDLYLRGVDTVVVCGVSTSGCVRATVLDAMCHGFRPMVVGSACGDRTKEVHEANMFDMGEFNHLIRAGAWRLDRCIRLHSKAMTSRLMCLVSLLMARNTNGTIDAKYADAVSEEEAIERLGAGWK